MHVNDVQVVHTMPFELRTTGDQVDGVAVLEIATTAAVVLAKFNAACFLFW